MGGWPLGPCHVHLLDFTVFVAKSILLLRALTDRRRKVQQVLFFIEFYEKRLGGLAIPCVSGSAGPRSCVAHRAAVRLDPVGRRSLTLSRLRRCALRLRRTGAGKGGWLAGEPIVPRRSGRQGLRALRALAAGAAVFEP